MNVGLPSETIKAAAVRIKQLEDENAALRDALDAQMKYQRDLRADRDRLDWVLTPIGSAVVYGQIRDNLLLTRDGIDRAMGVKP